LYGVEVVECIPPDGLLCGCVATMALISDDDVERVIGYVQLLSVVLNLLIAAPDRLASKQVDGHALDGADVHERMFWLWRLAIGFRKHLGIELVALLQVVPLKALAVYLVNLVELLARLRFKRGEGPNRLCGEHAPIN